MFVLEESVVYQDIYKRSWEKGWQEGYQVGLQQGILLGERRMLSSILTHHFGKLPAKTQKEFDSFSIAQIEELALAILSMQSRADLLAWFKNIAPN